MASSTDFAAQQRLNRLLNPSSLTPIHQKVFCGDENASALLEKFNISEFSYQAVWPGNFLGKLKTTTDSNRKPDYKELKVFIAIPSTLCDASQTTRVKLWIRFHGGGGVTGRPLFPPWMCQADYYYMLDAGDIISIEPAYCLMPESSGGDIEENIKTFCEWLFRDLPEAVRSINPNLEVDWSCLSIFGESFGGMLAMMLYLQIGCCPSKPIDLRISGIVLRCPLSEEYEREEGLYCGELIPKDVAESNSRAIGKTLEKMTQVERRLSTSPPNEMVGAYYLSVSGDWKLYWAAPLLPERIKTAKQCPDPQTCILIIHGTKDLHVPYESSVRLLETLQDVWPELKVRLMLVAGKEHAWDHSEPLTPEYRAFLQRLCRAEGYAISTNDRVDLDE